MKEKLKELLVTISKAADLAQESVAAGEHHINPVYGALKTAEIAVTRRIFQIEDTEKEQASQKAADDKVKAAAAAVEKAKADRAKFEADAIAAAELKSCKNKKSDKNDNE